MTTDKLEGGQPLYRRETRPFTRLRGLKCFPEVERRLLAGQPVSYVGRYVQEEAGEYADITRAGLISILAKFKAAAIPAALLAGRALTVEQVQAADAVVEGLDELTELQELYLKQRERLDRALKLEASMGLPMTTVDKMFLEARNVLVAHAELRQSLGLVDKNLGTLRHEAVVTTPLPQTGNAEVDRVLADPGSRRRVLSAMQRILGDTAALVEMHGAKELSG